MGRRLKRTVQFVMAALAGAAFLALPRLPVASLMAQSRPEPVKSPRIYVFDLGRLTNQNPKSYGFAEGDLANPDLSVSGYLIVHPKGTLQWDTGVVPDEEVGTTAPGAQRAEGHRLRDELLRIGYRPEDISFLALSHYHSDHTANANEFKGSTWLARKADRDLMFGDQPQRIMIPSEFSALKDAKTIIIDKDDYDVFGDGTVVLKSTPGHTAGHQVLVVKLAKSGTIVLTGDLYHYPEQRNTVKFPDKFPTWEFNVEQSRASRALVEDFLKKNNAQLWIGHDITSFAKLNKSPLYYE
jgi:N-acyl homoserine lactone hydrolase